MALKSHPSDSISSSASLLTQEEQIVAAIRRIMRAVDLHSKKLVETCGLTGPQLAVLQQLTRSSRKHGVSPTTLSRAVHLSQGTVTGILQRLEKRGLIVRTPSDSDRRSVLMSITGDGRRLLRSAPSLLQDQLRLELERLETWERSMILSVLERVAGLMGAQRIDASPYLTTSEVSDGG